MIWRDFLIFGAVVAGASAIAIRLSGSHGFCGTPNVLYASGLLLGLAFMAVGLLVGAIGWAWRRTHARD
jgi:hypothetical protein